MPKRVEFSCLGVCSLWKVEILLFGCVVVAATEEVHWCL